MIRTLQDFKTFLFVLLIFAIVGCLPLNNAKAAVLLDTTSGGIASWSGYIPGGGGTNLPAIVNSAGTSTYYIFVAASGTTWNYTGEGCGFAYRSGSGNFWSYANFCTIGLNGSGFPFIPSPMTISLWTSPTNQLPSTYTPNTGIGSPLQSSGANSVSDILNGTAPGMTAPQNYFVIEVDGVSFTNGSVDAFTGQTYSGEFDWALNSSGQIYTRVATTLDEAFGPIPVTGATGSFRFPTSSYLGPDFSNWSLGFSNVTPDTTYYATVAYQKGNEFLLVKPTSEDVLSFTTGAETSTRLTIPKQTSLFEYDNNNVATQTYIAELYLSTSSNSLPSQTSSEVIFTITPTATSTPTVQDSNEAGPFIWNPVQGLQGTPTWNPTSLASSSAVLAAQCTLPGSWTDIGGGLSYAFCSAINILFVPSQNAGDSFNNAVASLKQTPPVSWLLAGPTAIQTAVSASSSLSTENISFQNWKNFDGSTTTIVVANNDPSFGGDTTLSSAFLAFKTAWFNLCLGVAILLLLMGIILVFK